MEHWENLSLENISGEIWCPIKGYEGLYEISNFCRIKSLEKSFPNPLTKGLSKFPTRIKKQILTNRLYLKVMLTKNGVEKNIFVHRLIAIHFIPNPENKLEVNHIDGNPMNNSLENLEWCTRQENQVHAYKTGLQKVRFGIETASAKLSEKQVLLIRKLYTTGKYRQEDLAQKYNISGSAISMIINKKRWPHL